MAEGKGKAEEKRETIEKSWVFGPKEGAYLGKGGSTASSVSAPVISREPLLPVISQ